MQDPACASACEATPDTPRATPAQPGFGARHLQPLTCASVCAGYSPHSPTRTYWALLSQRHRSDNNGHSPCPQRASSGSCGPHGPFHPWPQALMHTARPTLTHRLSRTPTMTHKYTHTVTGSHREMGGCMHARAHTKVRSVQSPREVPESVVGLRPLYPSALIQSPGRRGGLYPLRALWLLQGWAPRLRGCT